MSHAPARICFVLSPNAYEECSNLYSEFLSRTFSNVCRFGHSARCSCSGVSTIRSISKSSCRRNSVSRRVASLGRTPWNTIDVSSLSSTARAPQPSTLPSTSPVSICGDASWNRMTNGENSRSHVPPVATQLLVCHPRHSRLDAMEEVGELVGSQRRLRRHDDAGRLEMQHVSAMVQELELCVRNRRDRYWRCPEWFRCRRPTPR